MTSVGRRQSRIMKKPKGKRGLLIALAAVVAILAVVGGSFAMKAFKINDEMKMVGKEAELIHGILATPRGKDGVTILLVGTDKRKTWKTARADALAVVRVYPKTKNAYVLSIPRDSRIDIPGRGYDKVNYAYSFGGSSLLLETIREYLGMDVHYYLEFDYEGFRQAIDAMGGVDFTIEKAWYAGELKTPVLAGRRHRDGLQSLAILKSREFALGDIQRVKHQQLFLKEASKQLLDKPGDIPKIAEVVAKYSKTNMGLVDMLSIGKSFAGGGIELKTASLPGSVGNLYGQTFSIVDEERRKSLVKAMMENSPEDFAAATRQ